MPDEQINDDEQVATEETVEEKPSRPEMRNKDLSEKVIQTAKERDEATAKAAALEKELEFRKGFSKIASKYEGATDYEDKILEKVNAGYDLEDATISVMAKAGKLQNAPAPRQSPAGGSASTAIQAGDDKPIGEMTKAEKRAALEEIDRTEPGSLSKILRTTNVG